MSYTNSPSNSPICPLIQPNKKVLVICEKPSIARDMAKVLGGTAAGSGEGYISFPGGYISWARGHMLDMAEPSEYRADWENWDWGVLPMIPEGLKFHRKAKGDCRAQLGVLKKLYSQSDLIVNACDAGREGELIWWEILRYCGWGAGQEVPVVGNKPALRFWAQSNTAVGLAEAWEAMQPVETRAGLAQGAYARSEADWLLGLNLTRGATLGFEAPDLGKNKKGFWSVGRVQTPVLALIAQRDDSILTFKSEPFYQIKATFVGKSTLGSGGEEFRPFEALVVVPKGVKAFGNEDEGAESESEKDNKSFLRKEDAQMVIDRILSKKSEVWDVKEDTKKTTENPPGLFSLTSLQKWCNQYWGWEAKRTLDAAQGAYESDKSLTYPRTDAAFLPVDSKSKVQAVYETLVEKYLVPSNYNLPVAAHSPSSSTRSSYLFDDSKLTDHYAIIPTGVVPRDLESDSGKVWLAVLRRFIVSFSDPAKVSTLNRRLSLGEDLAVVSGKTYDYKGWIDVDNLLSQLTGHKPKDESGILAKCGSKANVLDLNLHQGATTPPKHYTEATLLALMENIHTKFEDTEDELKDALAGKGLGTPATRAAIIELLIARKYILREKKGATTYLKATKHGHDLIRNLKAVKLEFLTQPHMTAQWEEKLNDMEVGKGMSRKEFLEQLTKVIEDSIKVLGTAATSAGIAPRVSYEEKQTDQLCPISGENIMDKGPYWVFPAYPDVRLYKEIAKKQIQLSEMIEVLRGNSPIISGFVSKKGTKFAARLEFSKEDKKIRFVFDKDSGVVPESSDQLCPVTGRPILDHGQFWTFPDNPIKFWKVVAKRKMKLSEYVQLIRDGKTKVFDNFVAKSGNKFSASLCLKTDQVGFDFPDKGMPMNPKMTGPGAKSKPASGSLTKTKTKKTW
jgi:DNA topoisomerase-3